MSDHDNRLMQRAIELARQGWHTTTPNPRVGCVIVNAGEVVGEGYHQRAGEPHAEVHALKSAGSKAAGATAYVTLEPCSHVGKTPPCADALIAAGIKTVVIGCQDPNPLVAGRGIAQLKAANITVKTGVLAPECEALNPGFFKRMRTGRPWVRVKIAMSLDGRIATQTGASQWITSEASRLAVQQLRAGACAVLTSSRTVMIDNPALNVRIPPDPPQSPCLMRQPTRVIVDSQLTISPDSQILHLPGKVIIFYHRAPVEKETALASLATLIQAPSHNGRVDLSAVMKTLGELGHNEILVEAGGLFAGALLSADLIDELIVYQAPLLLGHQAQAGFHLPDIFALTEAYAWTYERCRRVGNDIELVLTPR
ncbi:bifunctional diaminohydroxyphosphoribosylaminopyrimidine deaminase/5-amino-6-(5-phosphoribosylamino)uracil reductase RibD [Ostreibacterium oceani]|uniref:Riboflavin biosynthesis protein RibD n=1 Tax=Ostreibacterium oceani TaxID=2654998 RepID=A0A6N7F0B4_9GAMM|nr:bifunctional diaminohydroxyphosphoribosylaminopyrimidine deaminase/5-amino-6-(5-phosphoribosylamino)uracil reductase RibD [Ostreibacterium oceani]MPV85286.1 bifunctional diaminohydroxyphosphoribosylaminopyrimidine deaminase/5-amino-6-(5-phosphoribosylamino)uracil reductase RibD [Ostreibacterium oceani]